MPSSNNFLTGLVFGFDVGTGSIGYAVREGSDFKDVGVLICPEDTSKLDKRRGSRSQRRRLRNRSRVRDWLAKQLEEKFELSSPWIKTDNGQIILKPGLNYARISNPVLLRCEALEGRLEKPEELHAAIVHLWKRRGKTEVPWKQGEVKQETPDQKKEKLQIAAKLDALAKEMAAGDGTSEAFEHPCQLLLHRQKFGIKQRDEVWPRDEFQNPSFNLKNEFLAIIKMAAGLKNETGGQRFPKFSEVNADWILYGDSHKVVNKGQERHVYFKTTECENPGVLGLRWPRFDNRNPGLDLLKPLDELDRPLHVVRRSKQVFRETQFEQALFNFRVIDKASGKKVLPDIASLNRLRQIYELAKRKSKSDDLKISESVIKNWAKEFADKYELIEDQSDLVSRAGDGRAKFCSATLREIKQVLEKLSAGQTVDAIQPLLRMPNESKEQAMARFLGDIRHGLVRHRLNLFLRLLHRFIKVHGKPDFIVVEAVRSLAFSEKKKDEHKKEQKKNRADRDQVYQKLKDEENSTSKDAMLRYRLARDAGFECPFCRRSFDQSDLFNGGVDISHLYPKSLTPCKEYYNLTIAHARCNRTDMEAKIPREAFGADPLWPDIEANARKRFFGKKLELFLAQTREDAEKLIESKAPLAATAYISKMIRRLCLIDLEWQGKDGRDPTNKEGNIPSQQFLVTNGEITARYRETWKLNEILHKPIPVFTDTEWNNLTAEEKLAHKEARKKRFEKNRGDHRHHALDAMVISCTWPAYAQRVHNATKDWEDKGWWYFDKVKSKLMSRHPLFESFEPMKSAVTEWMNRLITENRVQHHASRSNHGRAYKTSFFSRRPGTQMVPRSAAWAKIFDVTKPKEQKHPKLRLISNASERELELNEEEANNYNLLLSEKGEIIAKSLAFNRELPCQIAARIKAESIKLGAEITQQNFYLLREKLADISPKDLRLRKIHPPEFSDYLYTAWDKYLDNLYFYVEKAAAGFLKTFDAYTNVKLAAKQFANRLEWSDFRAWLKDKLKDPVLAKNEADDRITLNPKAMPEFKKNHSGEWMVKLPESEKLLKTMPEDFQRKLCFSHYQKWSQERPAGFDFPEHVIIPIVRVRYRQPVNDNSVAIGPKTIPGWNGGHVYVKRAEVREVWLMPHANGPGVVPVFMPYSKQDKPFSNYEFIRDAKPLAVLRKRGIVHFAKDYSPAYKKGDYVVLVLGESVAKFALPHVANTREALIANDFPKSGLQAKWHLLIPALGFEFPKMVVVTEQVSEEEEDEQDNA